MRNAVEAESFILWVIVSVTAIDDVLAVGIVSTLWLCSEKFLSFPLLLLDKTFLLSSLGFIFSSELGTWTVPPKLIILVPSKRLIFSILSNVIVISPAKDKGTIIFM